MMRKLLRRHIPSMFQRRLLLLAAVALCVTVVLALKTAALTLGPTAAEHRRVAESTLVTHEWIPTVRGRILDRHGRVLAVNQPGYDVAVSYELINGDWVYEQANRAARRAAGDAWRELSRYEREALVLEHEQHYRRQADALWQTLAELGRFSRADLEQRIATITARVQRIRSGLTARRQQRLAELWGEPVDWNRAEVRVREEQWHHSVLRDVDERVRLAVEGFVAEAEHEQLAFDEALRADAHARDDRALAAWGQVRLLRPNERRYPLETITISLPTAHLPTPVRQQISNDAVADNPDASPEPAEFVDIEVEGVATHIIGRMREVWAEDEQRRPFNTSDDLGGYLPGDRTGAIGIERAMEDRLRGTRGRKTIHLDTGRADILPAEPGDDVRLTVDAQLQARVAAIMSPEFGLMRTQPWHLADDEPAPELRLGAPYHGAAVVMEVATGELLAAVSTPPMSRRMLEFDPAMVFGDQVAQPHLNRPFARAYQPGSTIKPMVLAAAVTEDVYSPGRTIDCLGMLEPDHPNRFRCWIFKQAMAVHGPLAAVPAMEQSCNIFFYTLGRELGGARLVDWFARFGLGELTGCGLIEEVAGDLPDPDARSHLSVGDATNLGIGQGPVRWTPIQATAAYAAVARGGYWIPPTLIQRTGDATADENPARTQPRDLRLDPQGVRLALQGLEQVVQGRRGTGRLLHFGEDHVEPTFDVQGVNVIGKSGTAQAAPLREAIDHDDDGLPDDWGRILKQGDHAWFIAMVGPQQTDDFDAADTVSKPTHVITVVVEYSGSGGQIAGPVVNQIIHAMTDEGYLP